jgi:hypothetical protein
MKTIKDFGQKIEGARKDTWHRYTDAMDAALPADMAEFTLAKNFPEPDYDAAMERGASADNLATLKALRDLIPAKPRKVWKLQRWAELVTMCHGIAQKMISGGFKMSSERLDEIVAGVGGDVAAKVKIYRRLGFPLFLRADGWRVTHGSARLEGSGGMEFVPCVWASKSGYRGESIKSILPDYAARENAVFESLKIAITAEMEETKPRREINFLIFRDCKTGDVFIGKKGARGVVRIKEGFKAASEARAFMTSGKAELVASWEKLSAAPQLRKAANMPRTGVSRREGNITPDIFSAVFGFRGVQFGNYVEADRRQADLNECHDALLDLAQALELPPGALSLGGSLGIAFGARGGGGNAVAHYEPKQVVINITKTRGPGSLAHEWFHAVDNYFSKRDGNGVGTFATDLARDGEFAKVRQALFRGTFAERSNKLDCTRSKPYYGTTIEKAARAFEIFISDRLEKKEIFNDYLANIYKGAEAGIEWEGCAHPFPREMDADGIRAAFDALAGYIKADEVLNPAEMERIAA